LVLFIFLGRGGPYANFTQFKQFCTIGVNIVCGQHFKGAEFVENLSQGGQPPMPPPSASWLALSLDLSEPRVNPEQILSVLTVDNIIETLYYE